MTVLTCEVCGCPTQRTPDGGPLDGLRAHQDKVHPDQLTVVRVLPANATQEATT
ncbi:hypothetical protein [Aeromicrobium sp. 9AM]|uniref:hypothetical protein n=1 Tax=Aeromicrobium sp. 9AM TaxID=2653126 RepID=UPI0012F3CDE5|nr:hypothetical protein [Aeromicrobium sp. 9AM]VXC20987.1 conserved hypothetical protein [Aeromicrobium sp. 9AM]